MKKNASASHRPVRRKPARKLRFEYKGNLAKPNMIYEFKTTKAALAALPPDVRAVLLLGGHIVNEINTLLREFIFNLKEFADPVANTYAGIHYFTIMRMLVGKTTEGLDVVQRRVFKRSFAVQYIPLVEKKRAGRLVVGRLRAKMNNQALLRKLRSQHVFHNPDDQLLLEAFDKLRDTDDWRMLCSSARHSVRFPMSQIVTAKALLDATGQETIEAAITLVRDEVLDTSSDITTLFEHIVVALPEHGRLFSPPKELKDISDTPDAFAVEVPPLVKDTTAIQPDH